MSWWFHVEAGSTVGELLVQTSKSFLADAAGDAGDDDDHQVCVSLPLAA